MERSAPFGGKNSIQRIVIRCPNPVGDFIMATPALRSIREGFPQARISLLLKPNLKGLIEGAPWFDELIVYDPQAGRKGFPVKMLRSSGSPFSYLGAPNLAWPCRFLGLVGQLRKGKFDLGVLLTNSFSSALMLWLAAVGRRIGYDRDGRRFLLTDPVPPPRDGRGYLAMSMVSYYLVLCSSILGCPTGDPKVELFLDEEMQEAARRRLRERGWEGSPLLGLNPAAGFGTSKLWTHEGFAAVADTLAERYGLQPLLLTGPGEEYLARGIQERMTRQAIDLGGNRVPLSLLKALIAQCALFVTTDSGPRHIAMAFDVPSVVLMGPTDPRYSDMGHERTLVLREEVDCSPCHLKTCPTDHRCMRWIAPERVVSAAEELMGKFEIEN